MVVFLGFSEPLSLTSDSDEEAANTAGANADAAGTSAADDAARSANIRMNAVDWVDCERSLARRLRCGDADGKIGGRPVWLNAHVQNGPYAVQEGSIVGSEHSAAASMSATGEAGNTVATVPVGDDPRIICKRCSLPMLLLLQINAPLDDRTDEMEAESQMKFGEPSRNEFRAIYVFACHNPSCHSQSGRSTAFAVLRCNGSKSALAACRALENPSSDGVFGAGLCAFCGLGSTKLCGGCRHASYCSTSHQRQHWKLGHSEQCTKLKVSSAASPLSPQDAGALAYVQPVTKEDRPDKGLYLESELFAEQENEANTFTGNSAAVEAALSDLSLGESPGGRDRGPLGSGPLGSGPLGEALTDKDMKYFEEQSLAQDSVFQKFVRRIRDDPYQVFRYYDRTSRVADDDGTDADALWVTKNGKPERSRGHLPDCESCGARRTLEFQIMPQLIAELQLTRLVGESIDWGILSIFTCERSCSPGSLHGEYRSEILWKQSHS